MTTEMLRREPLRWNRRRKGAEPRPATPTELGLDLTCIALAGGLLVAIALAAAARLLAG